MLRRHRFPLGDPLPRMNPHHECQIVAVLDIIDQGAQPFDLVAEGLRPIGDGDAHRLGHHLRGDQLVEAARVGHQELPIERQSQLPANVGLLDRLAGRIEMRADAAEPHQQILRHFPHARRIKRNLAALGPGRQQLERRGLPDVFKHEVSPQIDVAVPRKGQAITGHAVLAGRRPRRAKASSRSRAQCGQRPTRGRPGPPADGSTGSSANTASTRGDRARRSSEVRDLKRQHEVHHAESTKPQTVELELEQVARRL